MKKTALILTLLLALSTIVKAQPDSLAIDSVMTRIGVLLKEYNSNVFFVDTSGYEQYGFDAENYNLLLASSMGACNEILKLVAKGADLNYRDVNSATPLHYAITSGIKQAVEILLLLGADPDKFDPYGNTPLITAVRSGSLEISEMLIRYGATVSKTDRNGSAPLHHSVAQGNFYITDMLLYYDALTEIHDDEGNTPLMVAVGFGFYDITDILLQEGADPNANDRKKFTPLMAAAQNGDTLMLRMLINGGANIYAINNDGFDALCCAVMAGLTDSVTFLLDNCKKWVDNSPERKNPASVARDYGHKELVPLLESHGFQTEKEFRLEEFSLSAGGMFSTHYLLMTGSLSLTEPRMNAGLTLGGAFNPFSWRILVEDGNTVYQYRVNSSVLYAGLFKEFPFERSLSKGKFSITATLAGGYRFYSDYEGTRASSSNSFCIIPSGSFNWSSKHFGLSTGLSYLKTPFYKVSPLWLSISGSVILFRDYARAAPKKIRLYSYE